jgi:hypothetical protein
MTNRGMSRGCTTAQPFPTFKNPSIIPGRATSLLERLGVGADAVRLAVEPRLNDGDSG